jgi:hypothetical protein
LNRVLKMVHNATAFAHARGGDDDARTLHAIQALAVFRRRDKVNIA